MSAAEQMKISALVAADEHFDPILKGLEKAAPYFDEGPHEYALAPSKAMCLAYCMAMSGSDESSCATMRARARFWLAEGRRRYREGYYANPLAKTLIRRPSPAALPA